MRILLINPNTSSAITDRLLRVMRKVAAEDCEIVPMTAPFGVPYISSRSEEVLGGHAVLQMLAAHHAEADGAIVAAFGDPGLEAARELFDIPVVGLAEAGMLTACMLGKRFAIVTFAPALGSWYRDCVERYRLLDRCAGIRSLSEPFRDVAAVSDEKEELLVRLANEAVDRDEPDVIVLAGAPLAGLAERISNRIPVPVVDCAQAAIKQAELLIRLQPGTARAGAFRRPAAKTSTGLSPALAAYLEHRQ